MYNLIAKSIAKRKEEIQNTIDLNQDKFQNSPYSTKKLKIIPQIIYVKNNKDQLFMMSESNKNMRTYSSSHYNVYGKAIKVQKEQP